MTSHFGSIMLALMSIALILQGSVRYVHHPEHGRIGIVINPVTHRIIRVHRVSPAADAGLEPGDEVRPLIDDDIEGPAGSFVVLTVHPGNGSVGFTVTVQRVPVKEIRD